MPHAGYEMPVFRPTPVYVDEQDEIWVLELLDRERGNIRAQCIAAAGAAHEMLLLLVNAASYLSFKTDFAPTIDFAKKANVISSYESKKLHALRSLRNNFAHHSDAYFIDEKMHDIINNSFFNLNNHGKDAGEHFIFYTGMIEILALLRRKMRLANLT
jgi:hypothetical protein